MLYIHELIDLYDELDSAIFFDGKITDEFVNIGKYTSDQWKERANRFLNNYQKLLEQNATIAKYDYLLRASEHEIQLAFFGDPISRTAPKRHNTLQSSLIDNRPDEPFEGYFELIHKMAIPIDALRKTLEETGDTPISQEIPLPNKNTKKFGAFTFFLSDEEVTDVQYRDKSLGLTSKIARTFLSIMDKCYGKDASITISEINEFNHSPVDSMEYVCSIISRINTAIRKQANKDDKWHLIIRSGKRKENWRTNHELSYKINHESITSL